MQGGYKYRISSFFTDDEFAPIKAALSHTLLMFDAFYDVEEKAKSGNASAQQVLQSWADAEWFTAKEKVAEKITVKVFKVTGETNTDDLSPAPDAWSRPDIPVHAKAMLKMERDGITPDEQGNVGPITQIEEMQKTAFHWLTLVMLLVPVLHVNQRQTQCLSMGEDIPFVPKQAYWRCLSLVVKLLRSSRCNTMEDSGALPIELNVQDMNMGDVIDIYPYEGVVRKDGADISSFELGKVLSDEVRAGGRIPLIIGRGLTGRTRDALGLAETDLFAKPIDPSASDKGWHVGSEDGR